VNASLRYIRRGRALLVELDGVEDSVTIVGRGDALGDKLCTLLDLVLGDLSDPRMREQLFRGRSQSRFFHEALHDEVVQGLEHKATR
jgi:hypothetical protein